MERGTEHKRSPALGLTGQSQVFGAGRVTLVRARRLVNVSPISQARRFHAGNPGPNLLAVAIGFIFLAAKVAS